MVVALDARTFFSSKKGLLILKSRDNFDHIKHCDTPY